MIEFKNVFCSYKKDIPIFSDISMSFESDKITFLYGGNGVGKTTLIKCIMKQIPLVKGEILIKGNPIAQMSMREISKMVAFVPQLLDSNISYNVLDFITFGRTPYLGLFESPSEKDVILAEEYMKNNGIWSLRKEKINSLSGGERQLVYITRAMVQDTPVIIMDEPMSALDFNNQAMILEKIKFLSNNGKTIIVTSHNPNHALSTEANVCLIDKERRVIKGTAQHLLTDNKILNQIFGSKVSFVNNDCGYITFVI